MGFFATITREWSRSCLHVIKCVGFFFLKMDIFTPLLKLNKICPHDLVLQNARTQKTMHSGFHEHADTQIPEFWKICTSERVFRKLWWSDIKLCLHVDKKPKYSTKTETGKQLAVLSPKATKSTFMQPWTYIWLIEYIQKLKCINSKLWFQRGYGWFLNPATSFQNHRVARQRAKTPGSHCTRPGNGTTCNPLMNSHVFWRIKQTGHNVFICEL